MTAGQEVGYLRVGSHDVHIRPKVDLRTLLFLLSWTTDRVQWRDDRVSVAYTENAVDVMAHLLADAALRATHRGVLQGYEHREEALAVVRGRWRVADQIRARQGRFVPTEVTYDDYTEDIPENRIVVTALRHVRRTVPDAASGRHVGKALARFAGDIGSLPKHEWSAPPPVEWQPLNGHYRSAVELAGLVLMNSSITHRAGPVRTHGVLVGMNDLFERFVRRVLRESLGGDVRKPRLRPYALDLEGTIGLEPDVVWSQDRRAVLVADAKYKALDKRATREDLFQMLAYCTGLDVPRGLLVYATPGGPARHRIVDRRTTISVTGVDLTGSPDDIMASMRVVAEEARALVTPSGIPGRTGRPED
ncbi:hypothetical protein AB0H12_28135 [Actinosynnema sp. NPDC023794]